MSRSEKNFLLGYRVVRDDGARFGALEEETEISIHDAWGRPAAEARFGSIEATLPKGLYTVRCRLAGATRDEVVVLDRDDRRQAPPLRIRTATPLNGSAFSHEYYRYTAEGASTAETRPPLGIGDPTGRLFVFVRSRDESAARGVPVGGGIRIAGVDGSLLSDLGAAEVQRNDSQGWVGLSARAAPGRYRLHVAGAPPLVFPLHVFPATQTQVFLFDGGDGPLADTLKVFFRRASATGRLFDPADQDIRTADIALDALAQLRPGEKRARSPVPEPIASQLLDQKFEDPMLGLLGAYLTLHEKDSLPEYVLENLERLLPDSPDVRILRIASGRVRTEEDLAPLEEPPLLRYGSELAIAASAGHPDLVPEGSVLEAVAPRRRVDLAWTCWTPRGRPEPTDAELENVGGGSMVGFLEPEEGWPYVELARRLEAGFSRDPGALARELELPAATVRRLLQREALDESLRSQAQAVDEQQPDADDDQRYEAEEEES